MLVIGDYYISYHKNENKIVIGLPQTNGTAKDTVTPLVNRKLDFTDSELFTILLTAKAFAEGVNMTVASNQ